MWISPRGAESVPGGSLALVEIGGGRHVKEAGRLTLGRVAFLLGLSLMFVVALPCCTFLPTDRPAGIEINPPPPTPTPRPTSTPTPLAVYVTGAVRLPGVVQVLHGARVRDAVNAAGGPTGEADLDSINLAAALFDGQHVRVPAVGEPPPADTQPNGGGATPAGPVNINHATAEELTVLPGVGEVTAAKIVEYRREHGPFTRVEEILKVPGIGEVKYNQMRDMITVGP